ncbi:PaRep2a protein [Pyrobaculum aerophilum]|uniref:PaRep2a protein n=1 Tax=Pyrobaculum aerophilum TaxID=13773 RepID=UPI0021611BAA|nr:PaRep2a protein [Pyrobaculum aerophilum]
MGEYSLRRAFWWEWRGKPILCFVADLRAICKVGDKIAFYVFDAPDGVYLKPEIKLVDELIKVAHKGDDK